MYLIFDVGGTFVKYALMDLQGTFFQRGKAPTPSRPEHTKEDLLTLLTGIYQQLKEEATIEGISVSLPGMIDVDKGIVYGGGALIYMDGVHLQDALSSCCDGLPVALENDAKCAALCEVWKGNARDCQDACLLILGTGVGGAIVKDRRVHRGKHLSAGEFSYCLSGMQRSDLAGIVRGEGRTISLEEYLDVAHYTASAHVSVAGLCNRVAHSKGMPFQEISGERVYQWVDAGDAVVTEIVETYYFDIAKLCCNLQIIYDPEVILIGGGISAEPRLLAGIRRYAAEIQRLTMVLDALNIQPCLHRNDANLIGAMYHFCTKYQLLET